MGLLFKLTAKNSEGATIVKKMARDIVMKREAGLSKYLFRVLVQTKAPAYRPRIATKKLVWL